MFAIKRALWLLHTGCSCLTRVLQQCAVPPSVIRFWSKTVDRFEQSSTSRLDSSAVGLRTATRDISGSCAPWTIRHVQFTVIDVDVCNTSYYTGSASRVYITWFQTMDIIFCSDLIFDGSLVSMFLFYYFAYASLNMFIISLQQP